MPNYLTTYLGGNPPSTPEEGQQRFAKYKQWLAGLGEAAVSPANPLNSFPYSSVGMHTHLN